MSIDQESFNKQLYDLLKVRGYNPVPKNNKNQNVGTPQEAHVFEFTFKKDGEEYGKSWITIDDAQNVIVYFDSEQSGSPEGQTRGVDYDDSWSGFLEHLKIWAQRKQLDFELANKDRLGDDMRQREYWKMKQKVEEGYYPMGKQASYNDSIPTVKIILQHTRQIQEGEQRFRNVAKIFLENQEGERFLAPTTRPGVARVYARHLAEGGVPNDERWNHIKSLCEEYNKMAGFVRATRNGEFNESTQLLVNEGINHYQKLRETLGKMRSRRGYNKYFESWTPALMEEENDESVAEMFVEETLDPRIEEAMPILSRLRKNVSEMREVSELENWADTISNPEMVQESSSDKDYKAEKQNDGTYTVWTVGLSGNKQDIVKDGLTKQSAKKLIDKLYAEDLGIKETKQETNEGGDPLGIDPKTADYVKKSAAELAKKLKQRDREEEEKFISSSDSKDDYDDDSVDEDLDANQKRVGQLGPYEKVGSKGAVGKLVGESQINESVKNFTGSSAEPTESFDWLPPAAGSVRTISSHRKYKPGDQVEYAGGISTVVKQDKHGNVTLSNPKWYKDRVVRWHALEKPKPMKKSESITESVKNFTDAGIPKDFAEKLVSKFRVKHDAKLKPVEGKPRSADIEAGDMLINVLPSGEVIAFMAGYKSRREYRFIRIRYTTDGELKVTDTDSVAEATSGMSKRGPMFMLKHKGLIGGKERDDKPTPDEIEKRRTEFDPLSGGMYDVLNYMNKTFLPRLKPQMEKMVDEIYSNLRKLPKDSDKYGSRPGILRSQRAEALDAAGRIEDIMEKGFTSQTLKDFLSLEGVKISSRVYFRDSWEDVTDALSKFNKEDPLSRAKWAKTLLASAKHYRDMVRDMLAQPVMKELTRENSINELDELEHLKRLL